MKKTTVFSVALFMFLVQVSWAKIVPESIVAAWFFDEGKGKDVEDSSAHSITAR